MRGSGFKAPVDVPALLDVVRDGGAGAVPTSSTALGRLVHEARGAQKPLSEKLRLSAS